MIARTQKGGLQVANSLVALVQNKIMPGIDIKSDIFWTAFEAALKKLGPKNKALVKKRETLQAQIDDWHHASKGQDHNAVAYKPQPVWIRK
jgi:malate synthase